MGYNIRYFHKAKYYLDDWYKAKEEAVAAAKAIRTMGHKARVVPAPCQGYGTSHYLVYYKLD